MFPQNNRLVERLKVLADKKGCTPAQLALAWVHAQVRLHLLLRLDTVFHPGSRLTPTFV